MILISKVTGRTITAADIGLKTISDHVWILCDLMLGNSTTPQQHWSLNKTLLHSDMMRTEITKDIQTYLSENSTTDCSEAIIWDALKATLRGTLIAKSSHLKKLRLQKAQSLLENIKRLEDLTQNIQKCWNI